MSNRRYIESLTPQEHIKRELDEDNELSKIYHLSQEYKPLFKFLKK